VSALRDPAVKAKLAQIAMVPAGTTADELGTFVASEVTKWGAVIKSAHITIDDG
jgi:tripartite-type tricarboxylate transporter receptor subunit TctC